MINLQGKTIYFPPDSSLSSSEYKVEKDLAHIESSTKVYLINSKDFQKKVLKVYTDKELFFSESRCIKLSHPHLATPIMVGVTLNILNPLGELEDEELPYAMMEYCSRRDLLDLIYSKQDLLKEQVVRTYFKQIVEALEHMHMNGIAHGDIKPQNIFVNRKYQLKLADFDRSYVEGDESITQGSPNYRPAEMTEADCFDAFKADFYALGIVLFTLFFHRLPFKEEDLRLRNVLYANPKEFWKQIAKSRGEDNPDWNDDFKVLFEGLTKKNPFERFSFDDIKNNKWYQGETFTKKGLRNWMRRNPSDVPAEGF